MKDEREPLLVMGLEKINHIVIGLVQEKERIGIDCMAGSILYSLVCD